VKREFSAGGVVVRRLKGRDVAAVVHVKKHKVIALPKGHPDGSETMKEAATREVREETGLEAELIEKLGDVRYWYSRRKAGRIFKVVSFYLFRYRSGSIKDHDDEIELVEWVPLEDLPKVLAYPGEREIAEKTIERVRASADR
jgi:8-oxo-dGTP pyrophosphatase MutT (NUDIX family)